MQSLDPMCGKEEVNVITILNDRVSSRLKKKPRRQLKFPELSMNKDNSLDRLSPPARKEYFTQKNLAKGRADQLMRTTKKLPKMKGKIIIYKDLYQTIAAKAE